MLSLRVVFALPLALLVVTTGARAQAPSVPADRSFRDWLVGCDNTRSCIAVGTMEEDGSESAFVHVERAAGGESRPIIRLIRYDDATPLPGTLIVTIDGQSIAGLQPRRPAQPVDGYEGFISVTLTAAEVAPFVDAVRRGQRLQLATPDGGTAQVSLSGAMAALLFIDDVQGRVDSVTALARPGPRPATAVPAAPPIPRVQARPAGRAKAADSTLARRLRDQWESHGSDRCDPREPDAAFTDEVLPLGGDLDLVAIACTSGAYNFESVYTIVTAGDVNRARPAGFPVPDGQGGSPGGVTDSLVNAGFDPATGRLGFFSKGRGLGDCGTTGQYAWTGGEFVLISWRSMPMCRGIPEPFWPALWQADVR